MAYEFLIAFHGNDSPALYRFRDKTRYWSKFTTFHTPSALGGSVKGTLSEFRHNIQCRKTMVVLPEHEDV